MKGELYRIEFSHGAWKRKQDRIAFEPEKKPVEMQVVNLYPHISYQTWRGFGGALTEASGYVLEQMSSAEQKQVMEDYYGKDGLRYNCGRIHLDSCDFALGNYSAMEQDTENFQDFSLERGMQYTEKMISMAKELAGEPLYMILSPWSPPSYMKSNGEKNHGGYLKKEYYGKWAAYICHYIKELEKRNISVSACTIQNEPMAVQTWDSCIYSAEEERIFLEQYLYPELMKNRLSPDIFVWDHNKERAYERIRDIMNENTAGMIKGVAYHWYSGDHFEALRLIREQYSDLLLMHSEGCVEYCRYEKDDEIGQAHRYAHDIIGDMNSGANFYVDWNLLLDELGGPNHVKNYCAAPLMYDAKTGILKKNGSYWYIGQFSRHICPGARRIAFTKYTDALDMTAFQNPDGSVVAVFLNKSDQILKISLRIRGMLGTLTIPGKEIATLEIAENI